MQSFKKHINQDGVASPATRGDVSAGPHSAVPMPRWTLALRILQFIFAILVLGLTAYAEHIYDHEYVWNILSSPVPISPVGVDERLYVNKADSLFYFAAATGLHSSSARSHSHHPSLHSADNLTSGYPAPPLPSRRGVCG